MPIDINTFPISGRLLMTLLLWGGVSAFALGPLVAEREIKRTNWGAVCVATLPHPVDANRTAQSAVPELRCRDLDQILDGLFGQGTGQALCSDQVEATIDGTIDLFRKFDPSQRAQDAARELSAKTNEDVARLAPTR